MYVYVNQLAFKEGQFWQTISNSSFPVGSGRGLIIIIVYWAQINLISHYLYSNISTHSTYIHTYLINRGPRLQESALFATISPRLT